MAMPAKVSPRFRGRYRDQAEEEEEDEKKPSSCRHAESVGNTSLWDTASFAVISNLTENARLTVWVIS